MYLHTYIHTYIQKTIYVLLNFHHEKYDFLKTKSYHKTKKIKSKLLYIHKLSRGNK